MRVVAAFDQSQAANAVYEHNWGLKPRSRNLDNIDPGEIPPADIWWLSPPCKPFTVRGNRKDSKDRRATSFLHLISLVPSCTPDYIFVENVLGFQGSGVHYCLTQTLLRTGYYVGELVLCPTAFGIPMRRPRCFIAAGRRPFDRQAPDPPAGPARSLREFLDETGYPAELVLPPETLTRYGAGFHILDPKAADARAICFTSGYWRCHRASGSLLALTDGSVRRFSPEEIVRLLGFSDGFSFPAELDLATRLRLAGNSVDVRSIGHLLGLALKLEPAEPDRVSILESIEVTKVRVNSL